jgi:hypothetical protein
MMATTMAMAMMTEKEKRTNTCMSGAFGNQLAWIRFVI